MEKDNWILGKIFLRKYNARFCPSSRMIGFYINKNEKVIKKTEINKKDKKKENMKKNNINNVSNEVIGYIKIIIIALIFTGIGLYIGKIIFFPRRKRANELKDEYYQYDVNYSKKNDSEEINNYSESFSSIEMNSKLGIK